MSRQFSTARGATRVVFGRGISREIHAEVERLGAARALVVCTPGRRGEGIAVAALLGARSAGVLATAREHVPIDTVTEGFAEVRRTSADALVAFGGGSAIGLAKALAHASEAVLPIVAIPTTYSGSEMTPFFGVTSGGEKTVRRDDRVRPSLVLYDPSLTVGLSREVTVTSLWNALAHAVEALWADAPARAVLAEAEESVRLVAKSVARLSADLEDADASEDALEGAYLAGAVLGETGSGLHHKLCHLLGGMFGLPHAATHATLLPHVVRFHAGAAPLAMAAIGRALGTDDAAAGIERLARATNAPRSLRVLGMPRGGIEQAASALLANPPSHCPRPLDRDSLVAMLEGAWSMDTMPDLTQLRAPAVVPASPGFGSLHASEALPGALPLRQNTPRPAPYGLYPELINGTPFTEHSARNSKVWMYRIRPSYSHGPYRLMDRPDFAPDLGLADPNRVRWSPLPIPSSPSRVDFVDGLVTLGGAGDGQGGPGYLVHLYAANADMIDRSLSNADGDLLIVPQVGTIDCRTELGWLRAGQGSVLHVPRGLKFALGLPDGMARGWVLEVAGSRLRLPEHGPIGSNGLADPRHFLAPSASYEDRLCASGFETIHKLGGRLYSATQEHSPFDVVAWQGTHVPTSYDLMLFNAMGSVTFDHVDPSIHTVLTAPLDDHGRAIVDFVLFRGRWDVAEHSFRPPFMHRNAASEINGVVRLSSPDGGYAEGCTFASPLLTSHGISTKSYDAVLEAPDEVAEGPRRLSDDSIWIMFESALPFRSTSWARQTPLIDAGFRAEFQGMKKRFDPSRP